MRAICAGRARLMSPPLNKIWPELGTRNLLSKLKQVVLPAPLGPIKAWMAPRRTLRSTPETAAKPPNDLPRPAVDRMKSSPPTDTRFPQYLLSASIAETAGPDKHACRA